MCLAERPKPDLAWPLFRLPRLPLALAVALGLVAFSAPGHAVAPEFGQWWWEGAVGVGQTSWENRFDGSLGQTQTTDLNLRGALNGFLGHPAIGDFKLDVDLVGTRTDTGVALDRNRLGFGADLGLFPKGAYPMRFFGRRGNFGYSGPATDSPGFGLGAIDTSTSWGGHFRARRGLLRGMALGFDRYELDFLGPSMDSEVRDRQFLDWAGGRRSFEHHVRLGRQATDYGFVDRQWEQLTLNVDERGDLAPDWRWEMFATGIHRESTFTRNGILETESFRLRNQFRHPMRERDRLNLTLGLATTQSGASPRTSSGTLGVGYDWKVAREWYVVPFLDFTSLKSEGRSLRSPRLGVGTTWNTQSGALDVQLNAQAGYRTFNLDDRSEKRDESQTDLVFTGLIGHGSATVLRKEVEFEVGRNQLRIDREPIPELPDLEPGPVGLGIEDFQRLRFSLSHKWDSREIRGWGQWSHRTGAGELRPDGLELESLSTSLHFVGRNFGVAASTGRNTLMNGTFQETRFVGASGSWRPIRTLDLRASYRTSDWMLDYLPSRDGRQAQVGVTWNAGLLDVSARWTETVDQSFDGGERSRRTISWGISRRFAGWLPFATGTRRRGVIR